MSRHITYRGATVDMDSMRLQNEHTIAVGNMMTNARGDRLGQGGGIAKTSDQIARERHRVQTAVVSTGLKGTIADADMVVTQRTPVKPTSNRVTETELPSGDIVVGEEK